MVAISDISPSSEFQVRKGVQHKHVVEYATAMAQDADFPAVKLAVLEGALVCLGGNHRIAAAKRIGRAEILADVFTVDYAEAARIALNDNQTHGFKLSKQERREALKLFVQAGLYKAGRGKVMSSRDIAAALGGTVSYDTILRWMAEDHRAIHAKMQRGKVKAKGTGEYDYRKQNAERAKKSALEAISQCLAAARGVKSPKARGEIRAALLKASSAVETLGAYQIPKEPPPPSLDFQGNDF